MPSTRPSAATIGIDQQARRPCLKASSLNSDQRGSVAMSVTMTGVPRNAAVPHEPIPSPTGMPWIAALYSSGRLGAAPSNSEVPSSEVKSIDASISPFDGFSTMRMISRRTSTNAPPAATRASISRSATRRSGETCCIRLRFNDVHFRLQGREFVRQRQDPFTRRVRRQLVQDSAVSEIRKLKAH